MKPARFDYLRPATLAEALAALAEHGHDAVVLSGGQSLVPMMSMRLVRPDVVIDLNRVAELSGITRTNTELHIGAMTRYVTAERSAEVANDARLLAKAIPFIGDRHIRNRGTIGGAIAHADPGGEVPLAACALGARVSLASAGAVREVAAEDFFQGPYMTDRQPDELVTGLIVQRRPDQTGIVVEHVRRHGDFAVIAVAAVGRQDSSGRWHDVRIALAGVGGGPTLVPAAGEVLEGTTLDASAVERAAAVCRRAVTPRSDVRASADYRAHLLPVYVARALAGMRAEGVASR